MASLEGVLIKSEKTIKKFFNGIPIPTFAWRLIEDDLVFIDYNRAAEEFTRGKIKDLIGLKASEAYENRPDMLKDLRNCIREKKSKRSSKKTSRGGELDERFN